MLAVANKCILLFLYFPTLDSLDQLWILYRTGELRRLLSTSVTSELLAKLKLESLQIEVTIDEGEYTGCRKILTTGRLSIYFCYNLEMF